MKCTAALSVLALAAFTAVAVPTEGKGDYGFKGGDDYGVKGYGKDGYGKDFYGKDSYGKGYGGDFYGKGYGGYGKGFRHHDDYDFKGVRNYSDRFDYDNGYYGGNRFHKGGFRGRDYDFDHYRHGGYRNDDFYGKDFGHGRDFGHGGFGGGKKEINTCSAKGHQQVCCDSGILGCTVQALGSKCSNNAYCCETGKSLGGLINIKAFNCLKLL